MLSAEESAELRMLQAKAYGRDGELSVGDAARLRELEGREPSERVVERADGETKRVEQAKRVEASDTSDASALSDNPATPRNPWLAALAVVAVFALGVGAGWMLFGRPADPSIGLTQQQRARGAELVADGDYDANSLRALLEREGVIVWLATMDAGEALCLIVDDGSDATTGCSDEDRVALDGLAVEHRIAGDSYTDIAYATLLLTGEREPAVHLDVRRTDE